jgi:adenylate cyclase
VSGQLKAKANERRVAHRAPARRHPRRGRGGIFAPHGANEEGTLAALKGHRRELIDPLIAQHQGRIVKTTGDGVLIEFASIVDAMRCAVVMQQGMKDRNANVNESERIRFRVGINVGDVIVEDDDILGDGVNVAARLYALAEPGLGAT